MKIMERQELMELVTLEVEKLREELKQLRIRKKQLWNGLSALILVVAGVTVLLQPDNSHMLQISTILTTAFAMTLLILLKKVHEKEELVVFLVDNLLESISHNDCWSMGFRLGSWLKLSRGDESLGIKIVDGVAKVVREEQEETEGD